MHRGDLERWLELYEIAWRTPGTRLLAELFSPHATYRTAPFEEPHRGLGAIAGMWEVERDGADEIFDMKSQIIAVDGALGVVRVDVSYGEPVRQIYRDLWVISFEDEDRCRSFEEWPFWPRESDGRPASGPA